MTVQAATDAVKASQCLVRKREVFICRCENTNIDPLLNLSINKDVPQLGNIFEKINTHRIILFSLSYYFLYFGYHAFHHSLNTGFQGNHGRGTTAATSL